MNDQIENIILNKDEFNTNQDEMVNKLKSKKHYQNLFKEAYFAHSEPITLGTIKSSLELYVRSLVALNSKFDKNINMRLLIFYSKVLLEFDISLFIMAISSSVKYLHVPIGTSKGICIILTRFKFNTL